MRSRWLRGSIYWVLLVSGRFSVSKTIIPDSEEHFLPYPPCRDTPSIGGFGLKDPLAVQAKLCRRMERFIKELFVFVSDPAVPSDNNAAERSLRHLVTSRKISGGTRSGQGTDSKMTLASLFGTWRARGLNPLLECRRLLTSPQL